MKARKRYGQHFLAPAWADKVVDAIAPQPDDRFLEIGPGPGALTLRLAPRVEHLTAIEVDRELARDLARHLPSNADVVTADFLDVDLAPIVAAGPIRVAGNLPYNISSPVLFRLLYVRGASHSELPIRDATVMLQREVADRLAARPGTKDYGLLTIFTTAQADVKRMLTLPPGAFRPAPKVHSAVVRLTFKPSVVPEELRGVFDGMVRSMFTQRRKTLANALRAFADSAGQSAVTALEQAGINASRRPETLNLTELVALASAFRPPSP